MSNMLDYLDWRGDLSFDESKQNEIDGLIFSELSYIPFEKIVPSLTTGKCILLKNVEKHFFELHGENFSLGAILPPEILTLLKKASQTKRFSNVKVWGYENQICLDVEKQFSAICFSCDNKITYIVYRGTDDTIIGWKEDLNMALFTPIPSQREGIRFLGEASKRTKDDLIVVGHSKGGNIAVYSALNASTTIKKRIQSVYSYDGPGFKEDYIEPFKSSPITSKIKTVLPSKSMIGRIFDIIGECEIVKSSDKGLQQHDAFTWQVLGGKFVNADSFEAPSDNFHELLKTWVSKLTPMERRDFVESFYKILTSSDAETLTDITSKKFKFLIALIKTQGSDKKIVFDAIRKLIKEKNAINSSKKKLEKQRKIEIKTQKKAGEKLSEN